MVRLVPPLQFLAVAMRVNHHQREQNQPADKENDHARTVMPQTSDEAGKVGVHPSGYTITVETIVLKVGGCVYAAFETAEASQASKALLRSVPQR